MKSCCKGDPNKFEEPSLTGEGLIFLNLTVKKSFRIRNYYIEKQCLSFYKNVREVK